MRDYTEHIIEDIFVIFLNMFAVSLVIHYVFRSICVEDYVYLC